MSEWISCKAEMPEEDEDFTQYLLLLHKGRMAVGFVGYPFANLDMALWFCEGDTEIDGAEVSHWMPLPEPPK